MARSKMPYTMPLPNSSAGTAAFPALWFSAARLTPKQRKQQDDGQRNSQQPQQRSTAEAHDSPPSQQTGYGQRESSTSRMMIGMGMPRSQSRIGIAYSSFTRGAEQGDG